MNLEFTSDSRILFVTDNSQSLRQIDIKLAILEKEYGVVTRGSITCIACTPINKFLFLGDTHGKLTQYNPRDQNLEHDFGEIHQGRILKIVPLNNGKQFFTTDDESHLKQWNTRNKECVKNYGKIHAQWIKTMTISPNDKWLFTTAMYHQQQNSGSNMKQISIEDCQMMKDYGEIMTGKIYSAAICHDSRSLFLSDSKGHIKQLVIGQEVIDYGKVHQAGIFSIATTPDSRFLYTSDMAGNLKQTNVETRKGTILFCFDNEKLSTRTQSCTRAEF